MATSRWKVAFPKSLKPGGARASDMEWERVMVQITFAFVIILGYLVSVSMDETSKLVAQTDRQKRRRAALESIVADLSATEVGRERQARIKAQREQQLDRLLSIWAQVRVERRLYGLLRQFEYAEFIPLSDDMQSLPTGRGFRDLTHEIDRVFITVDGKVAGREVLTLMKEVLRRGGYRLDAVIDDAFADDMGGQANALHFDPAVPTTDSLRMLKLQIVDDLHKDRESLVSLQYALVGKVSGARLRRLADMPIAPDEDVASEDVDVGLTMLDTVLEDLRQGMRLLPEVTARIRGTEEPKPQDAQAP